ncbi:MAG: response regulator [Deltaproteobacteria bacterium]|nr:response regulator [Deltaproteobacteria bacterium]
MGEETKPIIYIVDDDESLLRAMKRLISSMDMDVQTYASGREFLDSDYRNQSACLIVDVKMPGMSGMELQQELVAKGSKLPVVFVTAFDTEETRCQAKASGAAGYFQKPVDDQALLDSIQWALSRSS